MESRARPWIVAALGAGALGAAMILAVVMFSSDDDEAEPRRLPDQLTSVGGALEPSAVAPTSPVVPTRSDPVPPPARDDGCGATARPGLRRLALVEGEFFVYVPIGYRPDERHIVVIAFFEDLLRGPDDFLEPVGLTKKADDEQFVIVAPIAGQLSIPDTNALVVAALDHTRRSTCVDGTRLYGIGHGGGGRRARELRCHLPLSALAETGSGQKRDEEVCVSQPTPFIKLHGLRDERVPYDGGDGCYTSGFVPTKAVEVQWAARNDCEGKPREWTRDKKSSCRIWSCAATVVSCALDGGHDWPGAAAKISLPGCKSTPANFPIVDTVWRFFQEHGREITLPELQPATE